MVRQTSYREEALSEKQMSKLSTKGQTVIPASVRQRLELGPGDQMLYEIDNEGRVILSRYQPANTRVFRLRPVNLNDPNWKASTHKGSVIVYAEDEKSARQYAKLAYGIAVERQPDGRTLYNPWGDPDLVMCNEASHLHGELPKPGTTILVQDD